MGKTRWGFVIGVPDWYKRRMPFLLMMVNLLCMTEDDLFLLQCTFLHAKFYDCNPIKGAHHAHPFRHTGWFGQSFTWILCEPPLFWVMVTAKTVRTSNRFTVAVLARGLSRSVNESPSFFDNVTDGLSAGSKHLRTGALLLVVQSFVPVARPVAQLASLLWLPLHVRRRVSSIFIVPYLSWQSSPSHKTKANLSSIAGAE